MNIAIDVLAILGPDSKNRGIGNYTTSQFKKLFEMDKENRYFLLNFYEDVKLRETLQFSDNVTEHFFFIGNDGFIGNRPEFKELFGDIVRKFIADNHIDVFYITSPFDPRVRYDMNWFNGIKTVATLYDVIPYIFKDRYLKDKNHYREYIASIDRLLQADKLLAISQSAKEDIIVHFGLSQDKVDVIYAGTDECYRTLDVPSEKKNSIMRRYAISDSFIMCTGGDDDRKNIANLIVAYSKLPDKFIEQYQLVIACKLSQASVERYYEIASKHKVRNRVVLTNFVPQDDLILLYNLAYIVAFPSQYEGFGLPVVEAMACGTPVLTSTNSSLGEIAEGAAVLVNPFEVEDITRGLNEILNRPDLDVLIEKGYERIKRFTWEKVSRQTLAAIEGLRTDPNSSSSGAVGKIAFFTPLPPIQSGVSDYSVDILNELSEYYSIDVYIDLGYEVACPLRDNISVYDHARFMDKRNEYDRVIYQMGNSEYHAYMLEYMNLIAGVVVLHDYNLHGLIHYLSTKSKNYYDTYKQYLIRDYPQQDVGEYVARLCEGKENLRIYEWPCNGVAVQNAHTIIVHSDFAKEKLLDKDISRNVVKIPHYASISKLDGNEDVRNQLNITPDQLIIAAFGHIHETKRILPALKAFKDIASLHPHAYLYLVGKPSDSIREELHQFIRQNDLELRVVVTGYTSLEDFSRYMDAADICLNLRYPYNGESSGSLMRILSKGKCVVINNIGSFAEIPDECCAKIESPELLAEVEEVTQIKHKLEELIAHPELITSIGQNARQYAERQLDIRLIARQYASVINQTLSRSSITEDKLREIQGYLEHQMLDREGYYKLAATLAYSKQ